VRVEAADYQNHMDDMTSTFEVAAFAKVDDIATEGNTNTVEVNGVVVQHAIEPEVFATTKQYFLPNEKV
jgi:hypothetical protein